MLNIDDSCPWGIPSKTLGDNVLRDVVGVAYSRKYTGTVCDL
jgi:hypothetical protein